MQSHWATTEWFKLCLEIWKTVKYQCPAEMSDTAIRPPWYCSWILISWLSACVFVLSLDSMKYSLCMLKWKSSSVVKFGTLICQVVFTLIFFHSCLVHMLSDMFMMMFIIYYIILSYVLVLVLAQTFETILLLYV